MTQTLTRDTERLSEETVSTVEDLWRDHSTYVWRFIRRRCSSDDLTHEVVMETFISAAKALARGKEVTRAWLMTVARRRLVDNWRSSGRQTQLADRLAVGADVVGEAADVRIGLDLALSDALNNLCETQRTALILRYCADRTVQEVADALSLTYTATESLLGRGRRRLALEYPLEN